jgi:hypothetical protein
MVDRRSSCARKRRQRNPRTAPDLAPSPAFTEIRIPSMTTTVGVIGAVLRSRYCALILPRLRALGDEALRQ